MIGYSAFAECCSWLRLNLDIVYFVYGLSFFLLGIAVLIQPRGESRFRLAGIIGLLGLFGLTHGMNEWLDMWAIIKGPQPALALIGWLLLTVSYIFLFEFGRRIFRPAGSRSPSPGKKTVDPLGGWLTPVLVVLALLAAAVSGDFLKTGRIWIRYLLGFPGGVLIGLGFWRSYQRDEAILKPLGVRKYFLSAGAAFVIYGILGGLVGPRGNFFPASRINAESFLLLTRIPAEVFRALGAAISAWAVIGILRIFNWETTRRLEDALAVREKVTEGIDEGIFLVDRDYKITWANKKERTVCGEIIGEYCYQATHRRDTPCQGPEHPCPIAAAAATGEAARYVHTHYDKHNQPSYVEVSAYPVEDKQGEIAEFVHITRDITEQVKLEETIKSVSEPLLVINPGGFITITNTALLELSGYDENELRHQPVRLLFGEATVWESIETLLESNVVRDYELNIRARGGETIPVLLNASRVKYQGRVLETVCLLKDLREIRKLRNQLIHSQTMQATGNLAGGIAHDFNNVLTAIKLSVQLLLRKDLPREIEGDLREIQTAADRADGLVGQLLLFSRREKTPKEVIDLNAAIEPVLDMLRRTIPENITITAELGRNLRKVSANRLNLQRLLLNLTVNARDAMPEGGLIKITTANVDISPGQSPTLELRPGKYVRLSVEDNGTGMDKQTRARVFEPFFTTKDPGRGTGMGLSVVYGIVKDWRGEITVESRPGEGSRFEIYLPVSSEVSKS